MESAKLLRSMFLGTRKRNEFGAEGGINTPVMRGCLIV